MLIDELRLQLKESEPDLALITTFYKNTKIDDQFNELHAIVHGENFWQDPNQITLSKRYQYLKGLAEEFKSITSSYNDMSEILDLFAENEEELNACKQEIRTLCKKIKSFKLTLLMNEENDSKPCFLSINAGAGGTESQDWAEILLRMYLRFCEREKLSVDVLDFQAGEEAGMKGATLYIKGNNPTGFLRTEAGIHRLVRISPFDANKRRHTSFAGVFVTPEMPDAAIEINEKDLRIDTYRAGGAGGQHVNKTDSAVRITHIPTGIVVQCQNERSQGQNKQNCMKMLKAKLMEKQQQERQAKDDAVEKKKIEWGSQIRSYVLHPYKMVKDHRTDFESYQPEMVLDGDIMGFIESQLLAEATTK